MRRWTRILEKGGVPFIVYIDPKHLELEDHVVAINRVTKIVRGGHHLYLAVLAVTGDKNEHVGFGTGKAREVPEATRKAIENAKKSSVEVPMVGSAIPYEVIGAFSGGRTLMRPAVEDSGVAAGGSVRAMLELAGVIDITSKSSDSDTPINAVCATAGGLKQLKCAEEIAELRGKPVEESVGQGGQQ